MRWRRGQVDEEGARPATEATTLVAVLVAAVAGAIGWFALSQPGALTGVTEYDDAVYFGAAVRLVHGALPYKDFVLVQPPGLPLLLTPFAALSRLVGTRDALSVVRCLAPVVSVAQVLLVGRIVRHRGVPTTLVSCLVIALFPDVVWAGHTVLIEGVLDVACLGGIVLAFEQEELASDRRILAAGCAFGFAGTLKLWAVAPALVVGLLCLPAARRTARFVLGGLVGFALPLLPFAVLAPRQLVRQVLIAQLDRPGRYEPVLARLQQMVSVPRPHWRAVAFLGRPVPTGWAVAAFVALGAFVGLAYLLPAGRPSKLDAVAVATTVLVAMLICIPPEFYYHYAEFLAAFLALALGLAAGRYAAAVPAVGASRGRPRLLGGASLAVLVLGGASLAAVDVAAFARPYKDAGPSVARLVPAGACAVTDAAAVLVISDRFVSSAPGCPLILDSTGMVLTYNDRRPVDEPAPDLVRRWTTALGRAQYVVLTTQASDRIPLSGAVGAELHRRFRLVGTVDAIRVYVLRTAGGA